MEVHGCLILMFTCFLVTLNGVDTQNSECPVGEVMIYGDCIQCTHQFCLDNPKLCSDCQGPCDSKPCINGQCSDGPNSTYTCRCFNGWTGLNCTVVLHCDSNPCHYGNCTEGADRYICFCPNEWTGANCETRVQDLVILYCESNPCQHGNCTEGADRPICLCPPEWTGANCETQVQDANGGSSPQMISSRSYFTVLMGAILALLMVMEMY